MTCLDLFLRLEGPELDCDRADNNVVRDGVVLECTQDVLRSVRHPINDGLNTLVMPRVPDFNHLVGAKTDQMISILVDVQVTHRRVMPVQIGKLLESIGLPEDDMALLATTCDLLMLDRIDETVDAFLMQIERAFLSIVKCLELVHVDEAIQ